MFYYFIAHLNIFKFKIRSIASIQYTDARSYVSQTSENSVWIRCTFLAHMQLPCYLILRCLNVKCAHYEPRLHAKVDVVGLRQAMCIRMMILDGSGKISLGSLMLQEQRILHWHNIKLFLHL